ncbi:MAG: 50S ribosomal protein L15e [Candidatus Hadarchaeia archaeon]
MRKETRRLKREVRQDYIQQRRKEWREGNAVERIKEPTKPERARELGYKDKQGVAMARVRVRRGGRRKERPNKGRRPKRMGVNKITPKKSTQVIAEGRVSRKFPNLEVLNSYKIGEDGKYHYYEVILLDPNHPVVKHDSQLNWINNSSQTARVERGLTSASRKSRGLDNRGKGSEKNRPSRRSKR